MSLVLLETRDAHDRERFNRVDGLPRCEHRGVDSAANHDDPFGGVRIKAFEQAAVEFRNRDGEARGTQFRVEHRPVDV